MSVGQEHAMHTERVNDPCPVCAALRERVAELEDGLTKETLHCSMTKLRVERLLALIKDAPHEDECNSDYHKACNCWKSRV